MEKYIIAAMPYPSGQLHIGHWYQYAIVDSYNRLLIYHKEKIKSYMAWDSFGLPTENAARKLGESCEIVTRRNIIAARREFRRMDTLYEFKFATHLKRYQERTQWLFNLLLKAGLAYKDYGVQDYCPSCQTVLAKEQIIMNHCERCDAKIESRSIDQGFIRIT
jgi:leucyl-tRNA synthetase